VDLDTDRPLAGSAFPPVEGWPALDAPEVESVFDDLQNATRAVRDIRAKQGVSPRDEVDVVVKVPADRVSSMEHESRILVDQARIGKLRIDPDAARPDNAATTIVGDMEIFVLDVVDTEAERARLAKEMERLDTQIAAVNAKLSNEKFVQRAKPEVVERERERLVELRTNRDAVARAIEHFGR
jgi:valyl-tRNA synthetase